MFVCAAVLAWWLTGRVRQFAIAAAVLDVPNARSSHVAATPRGGGAAIVMATAGLLGTLAAVGTLPWAEVGAFVGGGSLVALVGFADDCGHVAPRWRLLAHFAAAAWVLTWLRFDPGSSILGLQAGWAWIGYSIAALYLVWLLNLTNFMDGIDGLAAVEVITACVPGALLSLVVLPGSSAWIAPMILSGATLGFLAWNLPPAKIFMGDAGSGFLGLMIAAFSIHAASVEPRLFWMWLILFGAFIVDATITLTRRVLRGDRFYQAHCSHAYQHATRRCGAHKPVTATVGAINVCWLAPIAFLVALRSLDGVIGVLIAYTPLVALVVWLRAGISDLSAAPSRQPGTVALRSLWRRRMPS